VFPISLLTMDELSDTPTHLSKSTTLSSLTSSKTRLSTTSSLRLETSSWLPEDETWVDQVLSYTGRDIWVVSISFTLGTFSTELLLPGESFLRLLSFTPFLHCLMILPLALYYSTVHVACRSDISSITLNPASLCEPYTDTQTLQHFRHWRRRQGPSLSTQGQGCQALHCRGARPEEEGSCSGGLDLDNRSGSIDAVYDFRLDVGGVL